MHAASSLPASIATRMAVADRLVWRFDQDGEFAACAAAEAFLRRRGFSVGVMQGPAPRGILFGQVSIQKWRNLSPDDRAALHGVMTGSMRNGPISIVFSETAPSHVLAIAGRTR